MTTNELAWYVAHTAAALAKRNSLSTVNGRVLRRRCPATARSTISRQDGDVSEAPFSRIYLLKLAAQQRQKVYQSDYVANLLDVPDQGTFTHQLGDILQALETDLEVCLAPQIHGRRARVRIKSGPLRGLEGQVQERAE